MKQARPHLHKRQHNGSPAEAPVAQPVEESTRPPRRPLRTASGSSSRRFRGSRTSSPLSLATNGVINVVSSNLPSSSASVNPLASSSSHQILGLKEPVFIAIIAAAGVAAITLIGVLTICLCKRRHSKKEKKGRGWSHIDQDASFHPDSITDAKEKDSAFDMSGQGMSKELSFTEEAHVLNSNNPATPLRAVQSAIRPALLPPNEARQELLSPTTPNSAQPLLTPNSYRTDQNQFEGYYHPPPSATSPNLLAPPSPSQALADRRNQESGLGFSASSVAGLPSYGSGSEEGRQQYGLAVAGSPDPSSHLYQAQRQRVQIPTSNHYSGHPLKLADPPKRKKPSIDQKVHSINMDDVLNSFAQRPGTSNLQAAKILGSQNSLAPSTSYPQFPISPSVSSKTFGRSPPSQRANLTERMSIHSQMAEIAGASPSDSPIKTGFQHDPQLAAITENSFDYTPTANVPNVVVRSDSRQEGEYVFGRPSLLIQNDDAESSYNGDTSYVGQTEMVRKVSISRSQSIPTIVNRQESLKKMKERSTPSNQLNVDPQLSPTSEMHYTVGKALINAQPSPDVGGASPDSSVADFLPSFRDSTVEGGQGGFLTLQQMAMQEQAADYKTYRSPTYSLYGAYADDRN